MIACDYSSLQMLVRGQTTGGEELLRMDAHTGAFRPRGDSAPFPPATWFKGRPYLEVRVERLGARWAGWFNGQLVATADDDGQPKVSELRLNADGGEPRICSVVLTALERV